MPTMIDCLTGQFLIAMPNLADPNFEKTVTYICMHSDEGAVGIVVNRQLDLKLGEVIAKMDCITSDARVREMPVFQGGPVQTDRGFILHTPLAELTDSGISSDEGIVVTTSRSILQAIAKGKGPEESFIALGYSGWSVGQLEEEIRENSWIHVPASPEVVFRTPVHRRWEHAAALAGIDLKRMSYQIGHA